MYMQPAVTYSSKPCVELNDQHHHCDLCLVRYHMNRTAGL